MKHRLFHVLWDLVTLCLVGQVLYRIPNWPGWLAKNKALVWTLLAATILMLIFDVAGLFSR
jgi:hypothetical protein